MRGCCPDYRGTGHGDWSDPYGCPSCYRTGHLHPEEEKCTMDKTLSDWQAEVREVNEANGWHDTERTFGDGTALLHSEVSEMFEAYRDHGLEIGRASCRERVSQYVSISVVAGSLKKKQHTTKTQD